MRFTSETSSEGVLEQLFLLGDIPGVLWTPRGADGTRPLIAMGHGGGQSKNLEQQHGASTLTRVNQR